MRVIGGSSKGRRLRAPTAATTRPTSDRVREAVFDMLASQGGFEGEVVLDLYAGSGALGIEALSRGATHATFVERDRGAIAAIRANLTDLSLVASATVVHGDVSTWLDRQPEWVEGGVAFVDPPYVFDGWEGLLRVLPVARVVAESNRVLPVEAANGWVIARERRYGSTLVTILDRIEEPIAEPEKGPP